MNNIDNNLRQSMQALEDIRCLLSSKNQRFVDQASHHIQELYYESTPNSVGVANHLENLKKIFTERLLAAIENVLIDRTEINRIAFDDHSHALSLVAWDKVFSVFDYLTDVIALFPYGGAGRLELREASIIFSAQLDNVEISASTKRKVYEKTRGLLALQTFLTYEINESSLTLKLDFSHCENTVYELDLLDRIGMKVGFTNAFANYLMDKSLLADLSVHRCLEITAELELMVYNDIPDSYRRLLSQDKFEKAILYFPFLFRPISIIIPKEGSVTRNVHFSPQRINTGCGKSYSHGEDETSSHTSSGHYIDVFQLVSR